MEGGARDRIALDRALTQVAAHVTAVRVEDLQFAMRVGEDDQFGTESFDGMRVPVAVVLGEAEAVPSAGKSSGRFSLVDDANLFRFLDIRNCHVLPFVSAPGGLDRATLYDSRRGGKSLGKSHTLRRDVAAVDNQFRCGDVTCFVGQQEADSVCDFLRATEPAEEDASFECPVTQCVYGRLKQRGSESVRERRS